MKQKRHFITGLVILLMIALTACGSPSAPGHDDTAMKEQQKNVELYILAAASLSDALKELTPLYESSHPGVKLVTTFGSSGALQKQIEQGAPADLFISAASKQMNALVDQKLVDERLQSNLLSNELVLIVLKNSASPIRQMKDLQGNSVKKVAIGHPDTVPAGTYAEQALTHLGVWESIQEKTVFAKDVRQVLAYVETGNVDAGIVYKTDALSSDKVQIAAAANPDSHKPIVYPIGVIKSSKHAKEAADLYNWLRGAEASHIFETYGFLPAEK